MYEGKNWIIYDGDGVNHSTNGTWLFIDKNYKLSNGIIFKGGETLFKAIIVEA